MNNEHNAKTAVALATMFGVGRAPAAPGTAASVVALPLAWVIATLGGRGALLLAALLVFAVGTWACEIYAHAKGENDPSECVIDELAGQWIVCAFAPRTLAGYALAFLLFRIFDIIKPFPIGLVDQRVHGGLGIMADDVVAALMASVLVVAVSALGFI